jgi:hypothetical protein
VSKVKRPRLGHLVYVEMDDIEHDGHGWKSFADIAKTRPRTFRTVGWVVRATKRTLTLSATTDSLKSTASGFCSYQIPMRSITRIDKVK